MKLTAVFDSAPEAGYTCFVEEVPGSISEGETLDEAKAKLRDALTIVLACQREFKGGTVQGRSTPMRQGIFGTDNPKVS